MCHCAFTLFELAMHITKHMKEWAWKEGTVSFIANWSILIEQEDAHKVDHSTWITTIEKSLWSRDQWRGKAELADKVVMALSVLSVMAVSGIVG